MSRDDVVETAGREEMAEGFQEIVAEIERIAGKLEDGEIELEEALALFERGVGRVRQAAGLLDAAQGRVEELITSASGELERSGFEMTGTPERADS